MLAICDNRKDMSRDPCAYAHGAFCESRENGGVSDQDTYRQWLAAGLNKMARGARSQLAAELGIDAGAVSRMLGGTRKVHLEEVPIIARFLGVPPPELAGEHIESAHVLADTPEDGGAATVPVVGKVVAGEQLDYRPLDEVANDRVAAPYNATKKTVAFRVDGDSMGEWLDKWLVFFDDVRSPPTPDLHGQLCVVQLADGRRVLKLLKNGTKKGRFTLLSDRNLTPPIENVEVRWAAKVTAFVRA